MSYSIRISSTDSDAPTKAGGFAGALGVTNPGGYREDVVEITADEIDLSFEDFVGSAVGHATAAFGGAFSETEPEVNTFQAADLDGSVVAGLKPYDRAIEILKGMDLDNIEPWKIADGLNRAGIYFVEKVEG